MKTSVVTDGPVADAAGERRGTVRDSKLSLRVLAGLCLLESLSFGITAPVVPIITTEYFARYYTHGAPIDCGRDPHNVACIAGSKDANRWSSWLGAIGSMCFFVVSPAMGVASDMYGRRPFAVASQVLRVGLPFTLIYFAEYGGRIWYNLLLGLVASIFDTTGLTNAAVADIVAGEKRAGSFALLFALASAGFTVCAGFASIFSRSQVLRIAASLCVARALLTVFFYPETLPIEKRTKKTSSRRHYCKNPIAGMSILFRSQLFRRLTVVITITAFLGAASDQILMFYLNTVIGFDEKDSARLIVVFGVGSILAQLFLLQPLLKCGKEKGVIVIALAARMFECGGYVVSAFIPKKWVIYSTIVPSSLGDLSFAAISSLKSINCSDQEQGRLQGAIYSARAVFEAAGPVAFAFLYNLMKKDAVWTRVLPFAISIVLYGCGAIVAMSLPTTPVFDKAMPFSPVSSAASTPTDPMSASGGHGFSDDVDDSDGDETACLAEPLLGQHDSHGEC